MEPDAARPSLRQDFHKNSDSPRTAMDTLKGYVGQLDMKTMLHFLDQVSETKDSESSRHYAISLYSEIARVHKHDIIPFIPRIMSSILRYLPSSGGSPQLQQECVTVITSVATHSIDSSQSSSSNEEILRSLCSPLLPVLSSKLQPLAMGSAVCLQALVESEKWQFAPSDLQDLICIKGTSALAEKGTQTVPHMHLMLSLTKFSSSIAQGYGAQMLRVALEILQVASGVSATWEQRAAAAQLIRGVLKIADAGTLELNLSPAIEVLEWFQLDKVEGVRTAVVDALETAKFVALQKDSWHGIASDRVYSGTNSSKIVPNTAVQEFQVLSDTLSPHSHGSAFGATPSAVKSTMIPKRSPLLPVKQSPGNPMITCRASPGSFMSSKFKEKAPGMKARGIFSELPASTQVVSGLPGMSPHENADSFSSYPEGSKASRVSCSDAEIENEEPSAKGVYDTVFWGQNGEQFSIENSVGNAGSMCSDDNVKGGKVEELSKMMRCTKGTHGEEKPYKSGEIFEEFGAQKDCSAMNRSIRMTDDVLCNGCMDLLLTPDGKHNKSIVDSRNEANQVAINQLIAEDGLFFTTPRRLVRCLQSDCTPPRAKGTSTETCMDPSIETSSETSWSMRDNLMSGESEDEQFDDHVSVCSLSQGNTSTASSCCTSEELGSNTRKHVDEGVQSEEQGIWDNNVHCRNLLQMLDGLDVQAPEQSDLRVGEKSNALSSVDKDERFRCMQVAYKDERVEEKLGPSDGFGDKTQTMLPILPKVMESRRFIGTSSSVASALVILFVALAFIRYLSTPQDLHGLVPT